MVLAVLDNQKDVIGAVGLDAFVIGDVGVSVPPIPGIFPVKDCFSIYKGFVGWNVLWIALLVLFKQIVALFNNQILRQGHVVSRFLGNLETILLVIEAVLVIG